MALMEHEVLGVRASENLRLCDPELPPVTPVSHWIQPCKENK